MKKWVLCLLLAVLLLPWITFPGARADGQSYVENEWNFVSQSMNPADGIPEDVSGALAHIVRNGVLRVAVLADLAPRVFRDPARDEADPWAGADIELARLIARRMGVALKIVPLESFELLPSLMEEQCDLAISALSYTPARALYYTLSKGYYMPKELNEAGLIGIHRVTNYLEFRRFSSPVAVFEAVAEGKADAGLVNIQTAETYFRLNPDSGLCLAEGLVFTPEPEYLGDRIAARKGEIQLMYFVNGVIDEALDEGLYDTWLTEARAQAAKLGL